MNMSRENVAFCDLEVIRKVFNTKVLNAEDILRKLSVTKEEQEDIEKKTRDQSDNASWLTERQNRITGSKCDELFNR